MQHDLWAHEASLGELFGNLSRETRQLVKQEIQLARLELKEHAIGLGRGAVLLGAGGILAVAALFAAVAGVIALLALVLPVWLSALIVSLIVAGAAYLVVRRALSNLKTAELAPTETIASVREDVRWLKTGH